MKPTWAESQLIYARRLGVLRTMKPGTWRVYDQLLTLLGETGATLTIAAIARAAGVSRTVAKVAVEDLQSRNLLNRFAAPGDKTGGFYSIDDLQKRAEMLNILRRNPGGS